MAVAIFYAFVVLAITAVLNEGIEDLARSLIPWGGRASSSSHEAPMKKAGCALFGCAFCVVLLALAALAVLRLVSSEPAAEPPLVTEEPEIESSEEEQPVAQDPDAYHLTFRFRDPAGRLRRFSCAIRRSDVERERTGFGFVEAHRVEEVNRGLREALAREAAARGVARYFIFEVYGEGSFRWRWSYPAGTDPEDVERIRSFDEWLDEKYLAVVQALEERSYRAHGMRLDGDHIHVDYAPLIHNATRPLADCFTALRGLDDRRSGTPLGLLLTFLQDLRYEIPRDVDEHGRETLGFRVPTAVLVEGGGDCDSKAAVFCSLWRQLRRGAFSSSWSPSTRWSPSRGSRAPARPRCVWATATSSSARSPAPAGSGPARPMSRAASSTY